jgi:hypothetical protein
MGTNELPAAKAIGFPRPQPKLQSIVVGKHFTEPALSRGSYSSLTTGLPGGVCKQAAPVFPDFYTDASSYTSGGVSAFFLRTVTLFLRDFA